MLKMEKKNDLNSKNNMKCTDVYTHYLDQSTRCNLQLAPTMQRARNLSVCLRAQ